MPQAVNIEDFRRMAKRRLPKIIYDYIEGGSYDEVTLRANRADLDAIRLKQRVLVDVSKRSLATTVLGEAFSMPLILGPVGSLGAFARRGEVVAARVAERVGVNFCLSTGSICSIEEVRAALSNGEQVKLSGFGNFDLRDKNQRPGRNPKTGEEIPISARRVVTFRPGQKLKARVEAYAGTKPE